MKLDEVVGVVIKLRDKIDEVKKRHKEELGPLNEKMEKCENYLQMKLQENGMTSLACKGIGTAFLQTITSVTAEDWAATLAWIKANNAWEFLEHRVSKEVVKDFMEAHGEVPPGVKFTQATEVRIRRG